MFDLNYFGLSEDRVIVEKTWGKEIWLWNNEKYCAKILYFNKDFSCSYHFHKMKDEMFYCLKGKVKIFYGFNDDIQDSNIQILEAGQVFKVPVGLKHKIFAIEDSELFEVSTQHFDEDSYRL